MSKSTNGNSSLKKTLKTAILLLIAGGLLLFSVIMSNQGFQHILDFRALERIPLTQLNASVAGEVHLQGRVSAIGDALVAPHSQSPTLYYKSKIEARVRDSEGKERWKTVDETQDAVDMWLDDDSGQALVKARSALQSIEWHAPRKHFQRIGDKRYSEWRIDPGDTVTAFAWLSYNNQSPELTFAATENYTPTLSSNSDTQVRRDIGWDATIKLIASITAIIFALYALTLVCKIHRVMVFLTLATFACSLLFLYFGFNSLKLDVHQGHQRVLTQQQRALDQINQIGAQATSFLKITNLSFNLNDPDYASLSQSAKDSINTIRLTVAEVAQRYQTQIARFPEHTYAQLMGLSDPIRLQLPPDQQALVDQRHSTFRVTRIQKEWLFMLIGFIAALIAAWHALRLILVKRLLINIPTSQTAGVVFGLTEVQGHLKMDDAHTPLVSPLSQQPCCWYQYVVKQKEGQGKNSRWKIIEKVISKQPFYCEDAEGRIRIFPTNAEVISSRRTTERKGTLRYEETRLTPDDPLYVFGQAVVDKTRGDSLVIHHDKHYPFIISNRSEEEIKLQKSSKAMLGLSITMSALFFSWVLLSASFGHFSSLDFLIAAGVTPVFLLFIMLMLLYNDLIFLRQRCLRAWSNIQVSLKKRRDLLPNLVSLAQASLQHEATLLQQLTTLRSAQQNSQTLQQVDEYMQLENLSLAGLRLTLEQYPELNTHSQLLDLQQRLVKLENEISLIRQGYNDAVHQYNTRIQQFPEIILAKLTRFKPMQWLKFNQTAHSLESLKTSNS